MNETYNFNPDDKRMQLAALLQDPTQPYQRYKGPMGAPPSGGNKMMEMMMNEMMKKKPTQKPAPITEKSSIYDPASENFTPSTY